MKSDRQVLEETIELLENPDRWTKGSFGRDVNGRPVLSGDASAVAWCALGALRKVDVFNSEQLDRIAHAIIGGDHLLLMTFNDISSTLHGDLILAMKRGLDNL